MISNRYAIENCLRTVTCELQKRKYNRHRRTAILLSMELGLPRCEKTVLFSESSEKQPETIKKPTILLQDYSEGPDGVKITRCQWEISHTERNCSWYISTVSHLVYNAVRQMCNRTRSEKETLIACHWWILFKIAFETGWREVEVLGTNLAVFSVTTLTKILKW